MKYFLILIITLISNSLFSQGLTEKFTTFDISIGKKSLTTTSGDYSLKFVEESIRELEYDYNHSFDSKVNYTALKLGIKFGKYKGLSHELFFDVTIGKDGGGLFGYSIGYNFAIEPENFDILIRPSVGISSGSMTKFFHRISVDTTGIVLNDKDYIDTKVDVGIGHSVLALTPNVEFTFLYAQKYGLTFNIGYDFILNNKQQVITYTPKDSDFKDSKSSFDSESYVFRRNNEIVTDNIFNASTLKYSIGISAYWNRD